MRIQRLPAPSVYAVHLEESGPIDNFIENYHLNSYTHSLIACFIEVAFLQVLCENESAHSIVFNNACDLISRRSPLLQHMADREGKSLKDVINTAFFKDAWVEPYLHDVDLVGPEELEKGILWISADSNYILLELYLYFKELASSGGPTNFIWNNNIDTVGILTEAFRKDYYNLRDVIICEQIYIQGIGVNSTYERDNHPTYELSEQDYYTSRFIVYMSCYLRYRYVGEVEDPFFFPGDLHEHFGLVQSRKLCTEENIEYAGKIFFTISPDEEVKLAESVGTERLVSLEECFTPEETQGHSIQDPTYFDSTSYQGGESLNNPYQ